MFLLTAALLFAFLPQSAPQLQERGILKNGIDIKYPEIANEPTFNTAVLRAVDSLTKDFKNGPPKVNNALPESLRHAGYVQGSYTAAALKNGIVSVLLNYSEYLPGAAHPWDAMASVNYDLRTHRVLALSDLFQPGVNYLSRLSTLAIAALEQNQYADPDFIRRGAAPLESNFNIFTLTDTALVLHFHKGQVAPAVAGTPDAVIPLEKLAPLLRTR